MLCKLTDKCWRCGADVEVQVEDIDDTLYTECFCQACTQELEEERR